jgi:hypothetical protein
LLLLQELLIHLQQEPLYLGGTRLKITGFPQV